MSTLQASGTLTPAAIGTEYTVNGGSFTVDGAYVFEVDTSNMTWGDEVELRMYKKVISTSGEVQWDMVSYVNVQGNPAKESVPMLSHFSCHFTINQVAGTARAFPWAVSTL
ncbi:MAG: hypothetical protein KGL39_50690 [Patescibacteria group bacterium]|nr:hypothetical protein [Patescibacteria group bacterium]